MVGQEGESEGTELKRPALLWFAAYILVLPVSVLGIGSLIGFTFTYSWPPLFFFFFFDVCHVPISGIKPNMYENFFSSSIPSCYTNTTL